MMLLTFLLDQHCQVSLVQSLTDSVFSLAELLFHFIYAEHLIKEVVKIKLILYSFITIINC